MLRVAVATLLAATPAITLDASPEVSDWPALGQPGPIMLRGTVVGSQPDEPVTIEARYCGFSFYTPLFDTHTEDDGSFRASTGTTIRTDFRARWKGETSPPVRVLARPRVNLTQPSPRLLAVDVLAQRYFRDARAKLQRWDPSTRRWIDVKTVVLDEDYHAGRTLHTFARFRPGVRRGTQVRVVLPKAQAAPCYIAGYSNLLVVR